MLKSSGPAAASLSTLLTVTIVLAGGMAVASEGRISPLRGTAPAVYHGYPGAPLQTVSAEKEAFTQEYGRNTGHGNLLGIQAYMTPIDYRSADRFYAKLDRCLACARHKGWINRKTIVVFPEMIGFYLFTLNEQADVYTAPSLPVAAALILQSHPAELANRRPHISSNDPVQQGRRLLLEFKAPLMAQTYQHVFSTLARRYQVTVVAGSILLPKPYVREGKLLCDITGPLYNVSAVFRPDGSLAPVLVTKAYPTQEEVRELGVASGDVDTLPVFSTPAGKLGIAICADSWYPQTYRTLQRQGAEIVVVPSQNADVGRAQRLWTGYSLPPGVETPADVQAEDAGKLTEFQAWLKYAMPGRMGVGPLRAASIRYGMTVFARGRLWEETIRGCVPLVLENGKNLSRLSASRVPAIIAFWLYGM